MPITPEEAKAAQKAALQRTKDHLFHRFDEALGAYVSDQLEAGHAVSFSIDNEWEKKVMPEVAQDYRDAGWVVEYGPKSDNRRGSYYSISFAYKKEEE